MAKTTKKRTSLDDFASESIYPETQLEVVGEGTTPPSADAAGTAEKPAEAAPQAAEKPTTKKTTTFRPAGGLDGPVWERLWQINLNEGRRGMNSILNEAIDLFLKSRGQPSIKQMTGKKGY